MTAEAGLLIALLVTVFGWILSTAFNVIQWLGKRTAERVHESDIMAISVMAKSAGTNVRRALRATREGRPNVAKGNASRCHANVSDIQRLCRRRASYFQPRGRLLFALLQLVLTPPRNRHLLPRR